VHPPAIPNPVSLQLAVFDEFHYLTSGKTCLLDNLFDIKIFCHFASFSGTYRISKLVSSDSAKFFFAQLCRFFLDFPNHPRYIARVGRSLQTTRRETMGLKEDGNMILLEALAGMGDGSIERQEARGQSKLCASELIPVDIRVKDGEKILEDFGFILGDVLDDDPLFREATLPDGWSISPTDHAMWSYLLDGNSRKRGSIFYKAAFYDRSSFLRLNTRFSYEENYDDDVCFVNHNQVKSQFYVSDGDKRVFETSLEDVPMKDGERDFEECASLRRRQENECKKWLKENYPDWKDYCAYWD
jgi:hypothetical protein